MSAGSNPPRIAGVGAVELVHPAVLEPRSRVPAFGNEVSTPGRPISDWRTFLRWKRTVVLFTVAGFAAGLLLTFLQPRIYEARASLEVQDLNENFLNMKQVLPVDENGISGALSDLQTQVKILQSERILNPVLTRLPSLEAQRPQADASLISGVQVHFGSSIPVADFLQGETKRLGDTLKIRAIGQTRVIELTAESRSPRLAADFLNELCIEYVAQNMNARWEMSQHTSQSLARMLEETRVKLRQSQDALQNYANRSGLIFIAEKRTVAEEKLTQLQDELSKAEASRIAAQARYDMARSSWPRGLPDELSQGSVRQYQTQLSELERQRAELSVTYTPEYNKVRRLDAQIASLKAAIQEEGRDAVRRIESEYHAAARREALLSASYTRQSAIVTDLAQRAVQYKILEQEADGNRQLYDQMLQQVKEATVASAIRASNVRVLDEAVPPKHPHSPKPVVNGALGLFVGLLLGMLTAFARERSDCNLREPGDGYRYLGLPELGAVLHDDNVSRLISPGPTPSSQVTNRRHALVPLVLDIAATGGSGGRDPLPSRPFWQLLRGMNGTSSTESLLALESYRTVVTSILCASIGTPQLLVISSPGPSEGKTTVLANLGVTLAATGRRVLLIDADFRRPRLHEVFGLPNDLGLSTILEGERNLDKPLDTFIQQTNIANLSVLTSAKSPVRADRLHCPEFAELPNRFREKYAFVLIDTPPVLYLADARIIGRIADGVVLVVRSGQTDWGAAATAYERLVADGTMVMGLILNDWNPKLSPNSYCARYTREYSGS